MRKSSKAKDLEEIASHQSKFKHQLKLSDELMKDLDWTPAKNWMKESVWRKKYPHYHYIFELWLKPHLDATNPNCGVLSLYEPSVTVPVYGHGKKPKITTFPERTINIASYVDTIERLNLIIDSLTHINLF
jgi:hypothetical protein